MGPGKELIARRLFGGSHHKPQTTKLMKSFNTGRNYSPKGQLIVWEISKKEKAWDDQPDLLIDIRFHDVTRCITKSIRLLCLSFFGEEPDTSKDYIESELMKYYDNGTYLDPDKAAATNPDSDTAFLKRVKAYIGSLRPYETLKRGPNNFLQLQDAFEAFKEDYAVQELGCRECAVVEFDKGSEAALYRFYKADDEAKWTYDSGAHAHPDPMALAFHLYLLGL